MSIRLSTIADPVHGLICFDRSDPDHMLLLDLVNSRAFQRLRRIRQMGMAEFVFPGATHSRFLHSLGAVHLMIRALDYFDKSARLHALLDAPYGDTGIALRTLMLVGTLLHDLGHGPLSHTLEDILELEKFGISHDGYWNRRIFHEDPELQEIWQRYNPQLPEAVLSFVGEGAAPKHPLARLVSGQLDMDRLDYLQRDSHFLGVKYGQIEAERIILNLDIRYEDGQPHVSVREAALPAVEHFLFARHQAYKMAMHPLDKAAELTLKQTLLRFKYVRDRGAVPRNPANTLYTLMDDPKSLDVEAYLRLDDGYLWEAIHAWACHAEDDLLRTLAGRLLRHDLFRFVDLSLYGVTEEADRARLRKALAGHYTRRGLEPSFCMDEISLNPKAIYIQGKDPVWIRLADGRVVELSEVSSLARESARADGTLAGARHLLFVWDGDAKRFVENQLKKA